MERNEQRIRIRYRPDEEEEDQNPGDAVEKEVTSILGCYTVE